MSVESKTTTVTTCDGCGFTIDRQPEEGWIRINSHWGTSIFAGAENAWIVCSFQCAAIAAEKVRRNRKRQGFGVVGEMGNLDSLIAQPDQVGDLRT